MEATFRGMNTTLYPNRARSGTATACTNTILDGASLKGRLGFAQHAAATAGGRVLSMFYAPLSAGGKLVLKCADNKLYIDGAAVSDARLNSRGSWAQSTAYAYGDTVTYNDALYTCIVAHTSGASFDGSKWKAMVAESVAGWFFFWDDYCYHFDWVGGLKFKATGATYKAGIDSTVGGTVETPAATGGQKEGFYHVFVAKRNSRTLETSRFAGGNAGSLETRLSAATGGISISNVAAIKAADTSYEYDQIIVYCTLGNERLGLGAGSDIVTYVAFEDVIVSTSASSIGLNKSDYVLAAKERMTNAGGTPPSSTIGCFNGERAVYMGIMDKPSTMMFSIPRQPCMVPQLRTYELSLTGGGTDSTTFAPWPWNGELATPVSGVTGVASLAGKFLVYTPTQTWQLSSAPDGRLFPVLVHSSMGCAAQNACVSTPGAVHTIGSGCWTRTSAAGIENISRWRVSELMPTTYASTAVMGYYSFRNEVWAALPLVGETTAKRILIWDENRQEIIGDFRPYLEAGESITAMCELPNATGGSKMIIGLSSGRTLSYPAGVYTDTDASAVEHAYACTWTGYFGQDRRAGDQKLDRVLLHMLANENGINVAATGLRTGQETTAHSAVATTASSDVATMGAEFDTNLDGSLFKLTISSTVAQTAEWEIADMQFIMNPDK